MIWSCLLFSVFIVSTIITYFKYIWWIYDNRQLSYPLVSTFVTPLDLVHIIFIDNSKLEIIGFNFWHNFYNFNKAVTYRGDESAWKLKENLIHWPDNIKMRRSAAPSAARFKNSVPQHPRQQQSNTAPPSLCMYFCALKSTWFLNYDIHKINCTYLSFLLKKCSADGGYESKEEDISSDGNRSASRILSLLSGNAEPEANFEDKAPPTLARPSTIRQEVSSKIKFEDDEVQLEHGGEELTKYAREFLKLVLGFIIALFIICRVFEAVYRKMQTKKHKTWEGDGKVEVTGRCVVLKVINHNFMVILFLHDWLL